MFAIRHSATLVFVRFSYAADIEFAFRDADLRALDARSDNRCGSLGMRGLIV